MLFQGLINVVVGDQTKIQTSLKQQIWEKGKKHGTRSVYLIIYRL